MVTFELLKTLTYRERGNTIFSLIIGILNNN